MKNSALLAQFFGKAANFHTLMVVGLLLQWKRFYSAESGGSKLGRGLIRLTTAVPLQRREEQLRGQVFEECAHFSRFSDDFSSRRSTRLNGDFSTDPFRWSSPRAFRVAGSDNEASVPLELSVCSTKAGTLLRKRRQPRALHESLVSPVKSSGIV